MELNKAIRVAVINLEEYDEIEPQYIKEDLGYEKPNIAQDTDDKVFYDVAEYMGSIYSLAGFIQAINDEKLDSLENSFVRAFVVDTENEEVQPIEYSIYCIEQGQAE